MKFIHIADLHFGKSMHGVSLIDNNDQPYWAEQFIELVKAEKPQAVLIAGDVYDRSAPSADAVALLSDFLTEIAKLDVPVLIVSGNHDSGTKLSFASELLEANQVYISGSIKDGKIKCVKLNDDFGTVNFWLMPYVFPALAADVLGDKNIKDYDTAVRRLLENQNINFDERNVLIAHQNVMANGTSAERGGSETMVGGVGEINFIEFDGFDYVALGHIHAAQAMGRQSVRYAGSPLCYHFSELKRPDKGPVIVEINEKNSELKIRTELIKPLHPLREIKGSFADIISEEDQNNKRNEYVKVVLTDEQLPENAQAQLKAVLNSKGSTLMELSRYRKNINSDVLDSSAKAEEKTIDELFCDFYKSKTDLFPDEQQMKIISFVTELISRECDSSAEDDADKIIKLLLEQED